MKNSILFIIILIFSLNVSAQESLLLTSGKRIYVKAVNLDSAAYVFYKMPNNKIKVIEREDVFSWTRADSVEVIFYKPACTDVCFKIDEMRDYLHGLADGNELKQPLAAGSGFAVGLASGIVTPPIAAPVLPVLNSIGFGSFKPKIENFDIDKKYENNKHYAEGFTQSVRRKRVLSSLVGGGVGMIAGIIGVTIYNED